MWNPWGALSVQICDRLVLQIAGARSIYSLSWHGQCPDCTFGRQVFKQCRSTAWLDKLDYYFPNRSLRFIVNRHCKNVHSAVRRRTLIQQFSFSSVSKASQNNDILNIYTLHFLWINKSLKVESMVKVFAKVEQNSILQFVVLKTFLSWAWWQNESLDPFWRMCTLCPDQQICMYLC